MATSGKIRKHLSLAKNPTDAHGYGRGLLWVSLLWVDLLWTWSVLKGNPTFTMHWQY